MKKNYLITILLFTILLNAKEYANLPLDRAILLVKKSNIELSIASIDEKIHDLELSVATSQHFGSLNLVQNIFRSNDAGDVFGYALSNREASFRNFGFSDFLQNQQNPNLLDIEPKDLNYPDTRNFYQTKLQYTLPIFTGGKILNYKNIKKSLLDIAKLDKNKIQNEKIHQTKKAYADIILLDTFIKNLNTILNNIEKLKNMSEKMLKEGYSKKVDILEVKSKKANVLRMLNQSKANKKLTLQLLSFLTNSEVLSIDSSSYIPPKAFVATKKDIENMIDFKKAHEGLKISQSQLNIQKSSFLPTAGFIAEYGSSDDKFLGNFKDHDYYTIGVVVKWNLFNGGGDYKKLEIARLNNIKAKEQIKLAKDGLWLQISKLNTEIEKLNFDILSLNAELELAQYIYKNYLGRYKENLVSINDVLIKQSSELELVLKLKELQNKKYNKIFKLIELTKGEIE